MSETIAKRGPAIWRYCLAFLVVVPIIVVVSGRFGIQANLGNEAFNIARSLRAEEGFAHPFRDKTGPTAWVPPIVPLFLAGVLYVSDESQRVANITMISLQIAALAGTLVLVLVISRQTTRRLGPEIVAALFLVVLLGHFRSTFQTVSLDGGLTLISLDILLAGLCWGRPLANGKRAAGWGIFGGITALISPIAGFAWGGMSLALALRERAWSRFGVTLLFATLTLAPWTIRNYLVFGRLMPVKSNLAYELYQSQCLQPTGMLHQSTFDRHPYRSGTPDGREYRTLGETAYLDRKSEQFWRAVWDSPEELLNRLADRFLGTTLLYEPFSRDEARHPWIRQLMPFAFPLPFVTLLVLMFCAVVKGLSWERWAAIGVYLFYLLPYIAISYYDRYGLPLVGVKALFVVWALDELLGIVFRSRTTVFEE